MPLDLSCCSIIRHPWRKTNATNYKQLACVPVQGAKPCPFCGNRKHFDFEEQYDEQYQLWCVEVVCTECYVSGPSATLCDQGDLHKIAVEKWNKRGRKICQT